MRKRVLSIFITLVMLVCMLPTVKADDIAEAKWAFGTAETAPSDSAYTYSGTLEEAFTATNSNEDTTNTVTYVKLNKDVSMTHTSSDTALTLNEGKAMVLDLNSKTYSSSTTSTSGGDATYGIKTEPNSLLTVKNGTISVSSSNDGYAIGIQSKGNLNVLNCTIGASKENANSGAYGISYTGGVATITNCTITATSVGDRAQSIDIGTTTPALTIADCTVNAIGGDEAYAFYASEYWGKMEFDVAGTITAICANGAFYSKPTTNEVTVTAGEAEGTATDADASVAATYANKYVRIEPVKYDLYIGGVQVTSANKDDITTAIGNAASGSATYDPDTKTLTLNNFSCNSDAFGGMISIQEGDITIKLKGNNTLTSTNEYTMGIYIDNGNLVICNGEDGVGQGKLTINTVRTCINAYSSTLEINDVKVTAMSTESNGLSADSISLSDVNLSVAGGDGYAIGSNSVSIENSAVEAYCTSYFDVFAFNSAPSFTGDHVVYAGNDAASAAKVVAPNTATYTTNKYVRIEPKQPQQPVALKSTVEFVVDGKVWRTYSVTKGADIKMPEVPVKEGYVGKWDHNGENIRTATTINAVYTKKSELVNTNDLSKYSNYQLPVYVNSRVTNITSNNGTITVEGYMFKENTDLDKEDSIWREIIFVNEDDYSLEKAYRKQVTPILNTWLNKNLNATGNGKYKLDYANYTVSFSTTYINSYVDNQPTTIAKGSYLAYMRISDGTDSYLFPLVDRVLSDGSTLVLPTNFEVVDDTRALRYIVQ